MHNLNLPTNGRQLTTIQSCGRQSGWGADKNATSFISNGLEGSNGLSCRNHRMNFPKKNRSDSNTAQSISTTVVQAKRQAWGTLFIGLLLILPAIPSRAKSFIDYFLPTPIVGTMTTNVWGAATVGPRDPKNGLEDATMEKWNYWDGKIIKGPDGRYHLFASRWAQSRGHNDWWNSRAVHAVSDNLIGPYQDEGLCWPDNESGKGHNVTALVLPDGRYAVVISETRPGTVFVSQSLAGPWTELGLIQVATNQFSALGRMSNASIMVRPDGNFEIVPRSGAILISTNGVLGPYVVQGPSVYPTTAGLPQHDRDHLEDPVVWFSGGWYHIVVNNWSDRRAYHLISRDGVHDWIYQGVAYDATKDFVRYTDGAVNHWYKLERPGVYLENGHVAALTLAVIDVPKEQETGNDGHGSKVIVVPFDGAALDRDLQNAGR